jgi:hypothetical protein
MAEAGPLGRTQAIRILQIGRTHEELIATIRTLDVRGEPVPVGPRGRRPLSQRLGGILSGPGDPFRHDAYDVPSLADFVSRRGRH